MIRVDSLMSPAPQRRYSNGARGLSPFVEWWTDEELARPRWGRVQRRTQSAPTTHRSPQIRRRRLTISPGHVAACMDAPLRRRLYHKTNSTSEPVRRAGVVRWAPMRRAGLPRRASTYARPLPLLSGAASAPTRRPGALSDVTRSCRSSLPLIYRCRATRRRQRRRLTGRKSARHRRGLSAA